MANEGLRICFHGTDWIAAETILAQGFKCGTYFALHLEDALTFGGPYVFQANFDEGRFNNVENAEGEWWQFWIAENLGPEKIRRLDHYAVSNIQRARQPEAEWGN